MPQNFRTALEREKLLNELKDPTKVQMICGRHKYIGDGPPEQLACADCWYVFYFMLYAKTPPHKRAESLDFLEKTLRDGVQELEEGRWDFEPFDRPKITIERDSE